VWTRKRVSLPEVYCGHMPVVVKRGMKGDRSTRFMASNDRIYHTSISSAWPLSERDPGELSIL